MTVTVKCPSCGGSANVPDEYLGRRIRCSRCKKVINSRQPPGEARATQAVVASEKATVNVSAPASTSAPSEPQADPSHGSAPVLPQPAAADVSLPAQFGRYRIIRKLGQGGMGAVYLAHDTELDRPVALKVPHFTAADGPDVLERFHREAKAAATLSHPNLCPVYDVGAFSGRHFLTMAYIEGKPLSDYVREGEQLPERQVAALIRKLALALQEAHVKGVVHRDLKPANIMINQRKEPVIMDFGLARRVDNKDARLTKSGFVVGTPAYMAPELVAGRPDAGGPASDIYSLGVIMYEMLTGRLPFEGPVMSVLAHILTAEPERPAVHRPELDPLLEAICLTAMAKQPEERYENCQSLAAALREWLERDPLTAQPPMRPNPVLVQRPEWLERDPLTAQPPSDAEQATRWATPALAAGLAILGVALLIGTVLLINSSVSTDPPAPQVGGNSRADRKGVPQSDTPSPGAGANQWKSKDSETAATARPTDTTLSSRGTLPEVKPDPLDALQLKSSEGRNVENAKVVTPTRTRVQEPAKPPAATSQPAKPSTTPSKNDQWVRLSNKSQAILEKVLRRKVGEKFMDKFGADIKLRRLTGAPPSLSDSVPLEKGLVFENGMRLLSRAMASCRFNFTINRIDTITFERAFDVELTEPLELDGVTLPVGAYLRRATAGVWSAFSKELPQAKKDAP